MTESKELTLQEKMLVAIKANDIATQEAIAAELVKARGARIKAQVEAEAKETEALAGKREALANKIGIAVKALGVDKEIAELKAKGFNYYIKTSYQVAGQPDVHQQASCSLALSQPAKKASGGTGGSGKSKDEFGLSLGEIFNTCKSQYATETGVDIEKEFTDALEKDKTVTNQGYSYNVKKKVQKWAINKGLIKPVK